MTLQTDINAGLTKLSAMMPRCDAERYGAELYGAPRFSVFRLFGDKETTLSRILADLLDPQGLHGQGAIFLNELLRELKREPIIRSDYRSVHVRTEAAVPVEGRLSNRRIDILIETKNDLIGIENKRWTGESPQQVSDYWRHIRAEAAKSRKRPAIIFVSSAESVEKDAHRLPYYAAPEHSSVHRLLTSVTPSIRSPKVKEFIADFCNWIIRTFGRDEEMTAVQPYQDAVLGALRDKQSAKAIGAVLASAEKLRRHIIASIEHHLQSELSAAFPDMQFGSSYGATSLFEAVSQKQVGWHAWRSAWPKNCVLCVNAERPSFQDVGYGVVALDPESDQAKLGANRDRIGESIDALQAAVSMVPGSDGSWPWWRWARYTSPRNWSQENLAHELVENEGGLHAVFGAERMTSDLVALARAIDSLQTVR